MALFAKHSDQEFAQVVAERDAAQSTVNDLETQRSELLNEVRELTDQLKKALDAQSEIANKESAKLKELTEENDLLLAQLHQVQEELESFFLKNKDQEKQLADQQTKLKAETDKRAATEKQLTDQQAKLKSESDARNTEAAKAKDLQEENDLLLAQLHQVQEELERYYLANKDLEVAIGEATTTLRSTRHTLVNTLLDTRGFVLPPDDATPEVQAQSSSSLNGASAPRTRRARKPLPTLPAPPTARRKAVNRVKKAAARVKKKSAGRAAK